MFSWSSNRNSVNMLTYVYSKATSQMKISGALHCLDLLERVKNHLHRGPAPRLPSEAAQRHMHRLQGLFGVVLALEPGVHKMRELSPVSQLLCPVDDVRLPLGAIGIPRTLTGQHLQHHNPETVNVTLHEQKAWTWFRA